MDETEAVSDEVKSILEKWKLEFLYPIFLENSIDYEAFCLLNEDNIKEIIPKLGDRLKFREKLKNFKLAINPPTVQYCKLSTATTAEGLDENAIPSPSTSSASESSENLLIDFIEDKPLETVPVPYKRQNAFCAKNIEELYNSGEPISYDFDLKVFLEGSFEGRQILKVNGKFTPAIRNKLTDIIIRNELRSEDSVISTARFIQLARLIKQLFPSENIGTYYTPYKTDESGKYKRCARGKLFDKYHNQRRILRAAGLLSERKKKEIDAESLVEKPAPSEEQLENVYWLQNCIDPWTDVIEKWKETYEARKSILGESTGIQEYFDQFPALKQPLGYTLIELDYKKVYQAYENKLFASFPSFSLKILAKAKQSKDQNLIKLLDENKNVQNEDHAQVLALICLPYLFTKTVLIKPKAKNKKLQWRPSKAEVQQAFIVHLKSAVELQPFLERRSRKYADLQETCQPMVILIGETLTNYEVLLTINKVIYKPDSLLKSLDVIFKVFHVLELKYPAECEHIWYFIQKYMYHLETAWDKTFVTVEQLISDLNQEYVEIPQT